MTKGKKDDSRKPPETIIHLGTVNLGGKGPGSYVAGVVKLRNEPKEDLLASAESFRKAADRCLNGSKIEPGIEMLTVPGAVCAAFATELYLKYVHLVETGNSPPRGHKLSQLFAGLNSEIQGTLSKLKPDIADVLKRNDEQFTEARYHHEIEQFSFRETELLQLAECFSKFVRERYNEGIA